MAHTLKLIISYHKPAYLLKDDVFFPVHGGRDIALQRNKDGKLNPDDYQWLVDHLTGDNTGENISRYNREFGELGALYWAWKHYDEIGNPDFVGLMHYRRHFIFHEDKHPICFLPFPDKNYLKTLHYDSKNIQDLLNKYDVFAPIVHHTNCWNAQSVYQQYLEGPQHDISDLETAVKILKKKYPKLAKTADAYIHGNQAYLFNMFIMKRELFMDFAPFLFDILLELHKTVDYSGRSQEGIRAMGFVAERLTGIYLTYLKQQGKKMQCLPVAYLMNTDLEKDIEPAFSDNNVPVILPCDNNYVPFLGVTLHSLLAHTSADKNYDIFVLSSQISPDNQNRLKELVKGRTNVSLRFCDMDLMMAKFKVSFPVYAYYTASTYFRFFAPVLFKNFDKVIYLDSDMIILDDVAKLMAYDLKDTLIGACRDAEANRWRLGPHKYELKKYDQEIGLKHPENYFQAGTLIFNIRQMIKENTMKQFFEQLKIDKKLLCLDQDVLNIVCQGRVTYIDMAWNIEWITQIRAENLSKELSMDMYDAYTKALQHPRIIHYCDDIKPWREPSRPLAQIWWQYARQTAFYEEIIFNNVPKTISQVDMAPIHQHLKDIAHLPKEKWLYQKYKIMSKITFGKKKKKYKEKKKKLKKHLKEMKLFLKK